ncbi:MAG TPA: ATP-binding protein [Agitococcus sp.]|nr:ATP-binding protein [Agitococcus sp.]
MKSIRHYLLIGLFSTLLLTSLVSFLVSYLATTEEVNELHDAQLVENSRLISGFLNQKINKINLEHINQALMRVSNIQFNTQENTNTDGHPYERKVAIQVWDKHGKLLLSTPSAPKHALSPLQKGFFEQKTGRHTWFIYTQQIPANQYWLMVAERSDIREEMLNNVLLSMLAGSLLALVLMTVLIGSIIKKGLAPLTKLSRAMQERDLDYLQPVKLDSTPPEELKPVFNALNHLLGRLDEGLERERRFLADAAHELRTPLTVLKLQLQVTQQANDIVKMQQGINKALASVDRSTHTVEQLLTLARLEPHKYALQRDTVDWVGLTQEVIASLFPLANQKQQNLTLNHPPHTLLYQGNRVLLAILLRNLMENAIKYSPPHSDIELVLQQTPQHITLEVSDQGQGVPPSEMTRLTQRFYRHEQSADTHGTGLGLSIVQKILDLHDGTIRFYNRPQGGLSVTVCFPVL